LASTRILLVALPRMLEEIVTHILRAQRGMEIAGTIRKMDGLARKVARTRPDVVVLGGDNAPLAAALLEQSPRLKVLAVAEEGNDWWLYSLAAERTRLGPLSSARLVRAVQRAVKPRAASAWWN
jgi:DNA-binding NarL/FixJ family response regulator